MFVDASAIVAILTMEAEADAFSDTLEEAIAPITSAIAVFEAVVAVSRKQRSTIGTASGYVDEFLQTAKIDIVEITARDAEAALDAFSRYGKGRGHPAQLNMGDCFANAVAKSHRVALLFKGEDFSRTDIEAAHPREIR